MAKKYFSILLLLIISCKISAQWHPDQIEIIRDQWGVPHIYAPTDAQVSYGLAWAHSEDNFGVIQSTLLAAKGMLGLHLGKDGAIVDYVTHLLRTKEIVETHLSEVSPEFLKVVQGYLAGINSYAAEHPKEVFVKKAFPITVQDVFQAYVLQLAIMDGADGVITDLFNGKIDHSALVGIGSNALVFNRNKTNSNHVMLAVNAHQPLEGPASWYEAHLVSDEGWNMMGGLFPGGPVVFHGTNEHLGWAHTVNHPDKIDLFRLEINSENENLYRIDEQWYELEETSVPLHVKTIFGLKIRVKKSAFYSKYGPVIKNDKGVFAFKMAVFDEIRAIEQWYNMNKSTNLIQFKKALAQVSIPGFNIMYADKYDSIFYVSNAKLPLRDPAFDWKKIVPGNTGRTLSTGYHEFKDLPQLTNPTSGYLFNMNNSAFNASASEDNLNFNDFDPTMGYRLHENNRSMRFMTLIDQYEEVNWEDFLKIKYDATLPDSLRYNINVNLLFTMDPKLAGPAAETVRILQKWNRRAELSDVGPAHFNEFYAHLMSKKERIDVALVQTSQMIESLHHAHNYLLDNFGKIQVSLGEYQFLVRGNKALPMRGLGDVLAAMYSRPYRDGKVKGVAGESYIMLVRYPITGLPIIETIHSYGASNHPDSPHFNDQMEMFVEQKRKSMTLDIDIVRQNAESIYHPK
ncbi:MAG: peptidase S45 [Flammeovirgaceae bacterium]|nr:peptidase S45 [Flammeovirgaceae bacterium]